MRKAQEQSVFELLEALPVPAFFIGEDETILGSTQKARDIFSFELENRNFVTIFRAPDLVNAIETVLRLGRDQTTRYETYNGGQHETYKVQCQFLDSPNLKGALVVFENTTRADQIEQMRRDFVANVSHELRTPLTAMTGFIETLQGPARHDEAAQERFLHLMMSETSRMSRLVNELLTLSHVESQEQVRPNTVFDVKTLVEPLQTRFEAAAKDAGLAFEVALPDHALPVKGDHDQLLQLLSNLIENAIKYGAGGDKIEICMTYETHHALMRKPALKISVRDWGAGISGEHLPRLSERFYRVDTHRSREMGGTGLGLAIVKHIVNRHRGRMHIESSLGKGSTFTVTLPARHLDMDI